MWDCENLRYVRIVLALKVILLTFSNVMGNSEATSIKKMSIFINYPNKLQRNTTLMTSNLMFLFTISLVHLFVCFYENNALSLIQVISARTEIV